MSPRVVQIGWWLNDADREISARVRRLLDKSWPDMRWVWLVGNSTDHTAAILRGLDHQGRDVEIVEYDPDVRERSAAGHIKTLSRTFDHALSLVRAGDDLVLLHETDLVTPRDLIERMLATEKVPLAGWTVLQLDHKRRVFYDSFAYYRDGVHFTGYPPHHACYTATEPFEVDSAGSVLLFDAVDVRNGLRCRRLDGEFAVLGLCRNLKDMGKSIWVDPNLEIEQPRSLHSPSTPGPAPLPKKWNLAPWRPLP